MIKKISRKAPLFMAACMAFALALAGCGGSGSPADPGIGNGGGGNNGGGGGGNGGGLPSDTGPTPIIFNYTNDTEQGLWRIEASGPPTLVPDTEVFSDAITHIIDNEGTFVFAVRDDVLSFPTPATTILTGNNKNLTIIGMDGTRVLARGVAGQIINTSGTATNSSVTLRNITLRGQATGNTAPIVDVEGGWRFVMEGDSRIAGNVSSGAGLPTLNAYGAAVRIAGGSRLYMRSGQITGNRSSSTNANAVGGVSMQGAGSRIIMLGGTITGNSRGPSATDNTPSDIRIDDNGQIYGPTGSSVIHR